MAQQNLSQNILLKTKMPLIKSFTLVTLNQIVFSLIHLNVDTQSAGWTRNSSDTLFLSSTLVHHVSAKPFYKEENINFKELRNFTISFNFPSST